MRPSRQVTAIWALERADLESWDSARPDAEPHWEFVEKLSSGVFRPYVGDL